MRPSGRATDALRPVFIQTGFARHAEGSALIRMGGTEVLCAASVETRVPSFLRGKGQGWVTAEYGMLPRRKEGTRVSTLAAHRTSVPPMRIRAEPSAWRAKPVWIKTGRSASVARPDGRMGWVSAR